jgi:hypothetical protein
MSFVGANVSRSVGGNEIKGNRSNADKAKFGTLMDHQWAGYSKFIDPRPK